ncbi:MAG TPA: metallophosphoesterase [Pseudonocardiaceae bacterium]|nr:metallophosphoesterase [Pseudonocardiaceae bacterium]
MTLSRRIVFTVVVLAVLVLLFVLPWWTIVASDDWPGVVVVIGTVVFAAGFVVLPVSMLLGHGRAHRDLAARIGDTTLGASWVLFTWSVLGYVVRLVLRLFGVDSAVRCRSTAVAVLVVAVALLIWGYTEAMRLPRTRAHDVVIPRLGRDLDGLRVVVLADTHYGPINRTKWSARIAATVNDLAPDVVCHVGDLADGDVEQRQAQVAPMGTINATTAKLYITGNHEYFSQAQQWLDHMEQLGWDPLHNRNHVILRGAHQLVFAGVDDPTGVGSGLTGHGPDLNAALTGVDPELPVVLLAHQPKQVSRAAAAGVDLQLSGHTHGGQIWPFHLLVRLEQGYLQGLTRINERTQLYTSRGAGFWGPPFRVFAPSEITLLTLRSRPEA